ncbi:MAG: PA14 domain-containing protein, partial [Akkermansiaceae bacterium]|nr:PA14 domain-containing protein [Akkermansiaceae bacterium]
LTRHFAAEDLNNRALSGSELNSLRALLGSANANERQGACEALGLRQDSTALPTIVDLLENDPDLWVRAKAATAIRNYASSTISTYRDRLLAVFTARATDPEVIDWSDPLQTSNRYLSLCLFGNGVPDGTPGNHIASYTVNADKETLLYPALRAGLKQPDSYPRTGVAKFCRTRLSLADLQAVYPEVENMAAYDTPADRMWSGDCRGEAIRFMADNRITEGIPIALAMLEVPENFGWGSETYLIEALRALAVYGDAARYTLPTLRGYLETWDPAKQQYTELVTTINTIENAITAPTRNPGLCVADSQVVSTSGSTAITLGGSSPRGSFSYINVTQPEHGTVTGTPPNLTYTPDNGYTGPDQFTFQTTDTMTTSEVATVAIVVGTPGNGLLGEYFNNTDFTSPVLTRTDPQVNFDWGIGSPDPAIGSDTFSARWTGVMLAPRSGNYTFSALTSDGIRLYLNGQLVIDKFADQSTRWNDGTPIYLTAGQLCDLYIQYYENTGSAVAKLKWTGPGFAGLNGGIIPQAYLSDGSNLSSRPAYAFSQNLSTAQNTDLPVTLSGSGGSLSYLILDGPEHGTLSGDAPDFIYTPNTGYSGADSFTFLVNNGSTNSLPATIAIDVQGPPLSTYTWTSATSGNWSQGSNWSPGSPAAAGQSNYALHFTTAGTYTATHNLNNGFQLNQLTLDANVTLQGNSIGFTANGAGQASVHQNGGSVVAMDLPVILSGDTSFTGSGAGDLNLTGLVSGSGKLVKNGIGVVKLSTIVPATGTATANSYSGGTVVNSGILHLGDMHDGSTPISPDPAGTGPITLNGGVIRFDRVHMNNPIEVNGGKLMPINGWPTELNGPLTLNQTLPIESRYNFKINGDISGPGGITLTDGGKCRFAGSNTYTGATDVRNGILYSLTNASLGAGPLIITSPGSVELNYSGTQVVASLTLDGNVMSPGTYGPTGSGASHEDSTYFSGTGTLTVLPPSSTALELSSGSTPADPGGSFTFTATVSGDSPSGSVEFRAGDDLLGTAVLNGSFQATLSTSALPIGENRVTARYVGDSANAPSVSPALTIEINNVPPPAPGNLQGAYADPVIGLSWDAVPSATGYYVKRSLTHGGPYAVIALTTDPNYQDADISTGSGYYYRVSAMSGAGEGADSQKAYACHPNADNYAIWSANSFAGSFTDTPMGNNPDGDRRSNMMEFAFGADPTLMDLGGLAIDGSRHGDPVFREADGGGYELFFLRRIDHGTTGSVTYMPCFSHDLGSFEDSEVGMVVVARSSVDAAYEVVKVPFPAVLAGGQTARFACIRVAPVQ